MKILAFAASNSKKSINKELVKYASSLVKDSELELLDLNDYELPIYSVDREAETGIPNLAKEFFSKITNSDLVIISFAEHNGTYTAAYKNIFDWLSRINQKVYQDKKVILLSTSPGPGGAKSVLNTAVTSSPYFGVDLKGSFSLPSFYDNFDLKKGLVKNEELNKELLGIIEDLG